MASIWHCRHLAIERYRCILNQAVRNLVFVVAAIFVVTLPTLGMAQETASPIKFTKEETAWLKAHPVLKVGNENDWPPFDFAEEGKARGYSIDFLKLVGEKAGLEFEFVNGFSWSQLLDKLRSRELDILPAIMDTPERREFMDFTQHYMVNPTVVVTKDTVTNIHSIRDLKGGKVAIVKGYYYEESVRSEYPDIEVVSVSGFLKGLEAVVYGEADAFIGSQIVVHHTINSHFLGGLRVAGRSGIDNVDRFKIRFGVSKGKNILVSILEKGMNAITRTEKQELSARWIGAAATEKKAIPLTEEEQAWIKSHTVKVGVEQWPPIVFADRDGKVRGLASGFLELISESTGLKYQVITDKWDPLLNGLKDRKIDLLPATYYTEERATYGLYTEPYFFMKEFVYVKDGSLDVHSIDDLANKRIAVVKGYGTIPKIRAKYPNATIVETNNLMASIDAVLNGDVAALIEAQMAVELAIKSNSILGLKGISQNVFKASPVHFFSRGDEPLLHSILQKGLEAVSEEERRAELGKWISTVESERDKLHLTAAEQSWLAKHETIHLGIDRAWPPFEFIDNDGNYAGVSSGYISAIAKRLEVDMEPLLGLKWSDVIERVKSGGVDVLPAVAITPERKSFLNFTEPYIDVPLVIATRRDGPPVSDIDDLEGKTVGVVEGYASVDLLRADYPLLRLVEMSDVASLLKALSEGAIDTVFANLWVISFEKERLGLEGIRIAAPTPYSLALAMGVRKDWPELVPILNKALTSLSKQEKAAIKNSWMAVEVSFGLDMKTILSWAIPIGSAVVVVLVVIVVWNRKLGREVEERIAAEERTRLILESAGEGVFGLNNQGIMTFVNPSACRMLGYPSDEMIGQSIHAMIHHTYPDGSPYPKEQCHMRAAFVEGEVRHVTDEVLWRKDGTSFPVEYTSNPIKKNGELLGAVVTFKDVTERKKADEAIAAERDHLNTILNTSPVSVAISVNGVLKFANRHLKEMGYDVGDSPASAFVNSEDRDNMMSILKRDGVLSDFEAPIWGNNGEIHDSLFTYYQIDYEGDPGFLAWVIDITERKKVETKLSDAYNIISDSIDYAAHIQRSVLPNNSLFESLLTDHFVWWEPRDVVGGDIYWNRVWGDGFLIILGDCTGHGVPGAFMTLIATGALDKALSEVPCGKVAELMQRVHQIVQITLGQHREGGESDDGMELGICYMNADMEKLVFVGARFELYFFEDGRVSTIKGTKSGIGYRAISHNQEYEEHEIVNLENKTFYMTSDGIIDQVGGHRSRMFGKKRFRKLLQENQGKTMQEQKDQIKLALLEYQGEQTRRDDVAMIGFKV